ncbi:MAG: SGNH/GDSL hydrolase family protein [Planctomycetaceae bacterium]|nr:SGNH/GDSL hydrolase family protein [Planctomycetaceae bacterium]
MLHRLTLIIALILIATTLRAVEPSPLELLQNAKRVVFLGDSITAAGQYVADVEAWMLTQKWERRPFVINAGLPSETVSGLSEDGHAGGKFPRPDLAERLDRVLVVTKPDLIIACYGMNCGIYLPFDEARHQRYEVGLKYLREKAAAAGAKLIHITPPFYDDQRSPKAFSYNAVLDQYSDKLLAHRADGWVVIDLHHPMMAAVKERRGKDPQYTMQPDGVHPNADGHWFVAQQFIHACGDETVTKFATPQDMLSAHNVPAGVLPLVQQRSYILRDAYVATAGHKRPGVAAGLPLDQAEEKAAELTKQIDALLSSPTK